MIYRLADGTEINTRRALDFEQRASPQKTMIHHRLDASRQVWRGPGARDHPSPAARILTDQDQRSEPKG